MIINSSELKNKYENEQLELDDILGYLGLIMFEDQREEDEEVVKLAVSIGNIKTEEEFESVQEIFDIVRKRERTSVPPVYVKKDKFRGRMLSPNDIITMFSENIVDCCKKFGNVEMFLGSIEENCGIFVIEEYDEFGKPKIIGQSLVIRQKGKKGNNDRLMFDTIKLAENVRERLSKEDYEEILRIYQDAGKKAIDLDRRFLDEMVKSKKIQENVRDALIIKEVTISRGDNSFPLLNTFPKAETIIPDEVHFRYKMKNGKADNLGTDLSISGASATSNSYDSVIIASMDKKDLDEIEERNANGFRKTKLSEAKLWYGKVDKIKEYTVNTIKKEQIEKIKDIEKRVFREPQQIINQNDVEEGEDLQSLFFGDEDIRIIMGSEEDWYFIYGKDESGDLNILELALEGGLNSYISKEKNQKKKMSFLAIAEMTLTLYKVIIQAKNENRRILCNATKDTSLINIKRMVEERLAKIYDENGRGIILNKENEFVYETGEKVKYRDFKEGVNIGMLDLEIRPDVDKMTEKMVETEDFLEKTRRNKRMQGRKKEEGIDEMRRMLRDDLEI